MAVTEQSRKEAIRSLLTWSYSSSVEMIHQLRASPPMRISEAAAACGLTIDTIRYYEKSEMLPEIRRTADGRRVFSEADIEWLTLLYWLRETGMPLKQMRRFTALAKAGGATVPERRQILLQHAAELGRRQELLNKCQSVLAVKIAGYDTIDTETKT